MTWSLLHHSEPGTHGEGIDAQDIRHPEIKIGDQGPVGGSDDGLHDAMALKLQQAMDQDQKTLRV